MNDITCDDLNPECVRCGIGIDDIMCDDTTCEDLYLASVAGMDDITCDYLTYNDLNPETCVEIGGMRIDRGDFE